VWPRLVSRIDEIVVFDRLTQQNIATLLERKIAEIERYLGCWCIGFIIRKEGMALYRSANDAALICSESRANPRSISRYWMGAPKFFTQDT